MFEFSCSQIKVTTSGPAVTLHVTCGEVKFDVDLVVVFRMQEKDWPAKPFKEIPIACDHKEVSMLISIITHFWTTELWIIFQKEFMLVPKVPRKLMSSETKRCWRISFQRQESILLKQKDNCKNALRIIKVVINDTNRLNFILNLLLF